MKDVKDLSTAGAPLRETYFVPATNIENYTSGPADARPPVGPTDSEPPFSHFPGDIWTAGQSLYGLPRGRPIPLFFKIFNGGYFRYSPWTAAVVYLKRLLTFLSRCLSFFPEMFPPCLAGALVVQNIFVIASRLRSSAVVCPDTDGGTAACTRSGNSSYILKMTFEGV